MAGSLSALLASCDLSAESSGHIVDFEEEPVPLSVFVRDRKYLANPALGEIQYEAVRHIERVYMPDTYTVLAASADRAVREYWAEPCRMVNLVELEWGKGSGKDHICRISALRVCYLLLCLRSPLAYFELPEQDSVHVLNVASSSRQASRAFFQPMRRAVQRPGNWFQTMGAEVVEAPRRGRRALHQAAGQPTQALMDTIRFPKNIEAVSGHSDADTQEGLNLILGIADEVDAFRSRAELAKTAGNRARESSASAEAILDMLRTSGATRFPRTYKSVRISYPRYKGSTIQQLIAEGLADIGENGDRSRHYVSGPLATWEVNPRIRGKDDFAEDYKKDPILAAAKYECKPAYAINPYFSNEIALRACVRPGPEPVITDYIREAAAWRPVYAFQDSLYPVRGALYAMHADLAVTGDRAGLAMAHVQSWQEVTVEGQAEDGGAAHLTEARPVVKVDFVVTYEASSAAVPPREIQIRWAGELCLELRRRGFPVVLFTADQFQCLSGDTQIPLLDGTTKTMRELEGAEPFWVYSISNGRVVPGRCTKAWRTAYRDDMLEVELDNGEKVKATSDHRFMLRDGTYRRARDLRPGDSLMPLYRRLKPISPDTPHLQYEQVWHPERGDSRVRWQFTHSMVSGYFHGPVSKGWVTHHKDLGKFNNAPENLERMTGSAHSLLHQSLAAGKFSQLWANEEWATAHRQRISAAQSALQSGNIGAESRRYRHEITFEAVREAAEAVLAAGEVLRWRAVAARLGCGQYPIYARLREAGFSSWMEFRWSVKPRSHGALAQARYQERRRRAVNHKVVAVRLSVPEPVYDLQVEEHENFALASGVFVHNSVDLMQRLETYGIETGRFSLDKDEIGWRTLRDLAYGGRLSLPPSELLIMELLGLSRLPNGKVDHMADGSKDAADAVGGAVSGAVTVGGREDAAGSRAYPGGQHHFGGSANMSLVPIGMPPLSLLATEDPLPQEVRDFEKRGALMPGGGWLDDFGEVTPRMT